MCKIYDLDAYRKIKREKNIERCIVSIKEIKKEIEIIEYKIKQLVEKGYGTINR